MSVIMKCGHVAQGKDEAGNPVCVICVGITPNAKIIDESKPNLEGRKATCFYCRREQPSNTDLPFFEHRPDRETDAYYCGCYGWD